MQEVLIRAKSKEVKVKHNEKSWPADYTCNFLEAGIVSYEDVGAGVALLKKETIDKMLASFVGKPVMSRHKEVSPEDFKEKAVGYVTEAYFNPTTGWFDCKFLLIDDAAKKLVENGYSVSCSFKVINTAQGGEWHAIKYDEEITDAEFEHLALVDSPRYEDCRIMVNSKAAKIKESDMDKKDNGIDIMSPLQRDKYFESLSDSGIQSLIDSPDESKETKDLAAKHQEMRKQKKEEELLVGKPGVGKDKKNMKETLLNAKEAFVEFNGKETSVEELINLCNSLQKKVNDLEEMRDPKLKNDSDKKDDDDKKVCDKCHKKHDGDCFPKKNDDSDKKDDDDKKGNDDKKNDDVDPAKPKEEEEEGAIKRNEKKDAQHFVKLNNIKNMATEATEMIVDTLHNKIGRGKERYGSAAK